MTTGTESTTAATAATEEKNRLAAEFNSAINFALDEAGPEGLTFLSLWREGAWDEIDLEWPAFKTPQSGQRL